MKRLILMCLLVAACGATPEGEKKIEKGDPLIGWEITEVPVNGHKVLCIKNMESTTYGKGVGISCNWNDYRG